jgi:hypothetical protein
VNQDLEKQFKETTMQKNNQLIPFRENRESVWRRESTGFLSFQSVPLRLPSDTTIISVNEKCIKRTLNGQMS